jgi:penicillin-binding protein 1C
VTARRRLAHAGAAPLAAGRRLLGAGAAWLAARRRFLLASGSGLAALVAAAAGWIAWPLDPSFTLPPAATSLVIEDRHGLVLRTTRAPDGSRGGWLPLGEMDPQLIQAFVALEDRRFFSHPGVDWRAALRALRQDVTGGRVVSGASTITMQLARLLRPGGRGVASKLGQALWALRLERHLGKQAILEQYLNRVPLGQGAIGVSAAAALYFDASATRLSVGQAALLAGLASAPSSDNPLVAPGRARERRATALRRMAALGYVTAADAARGSAEPVLVTHGRAPFLAPHFTIQVLRQVEDAGLPLTGTWRTSLDLQLQTALESEVRHTVALLKDRGVRQAAAVALDNRTGEVLAWVGSPDFWADTAGQVDMVTSPRQPGSALKPFLYGLAFDRGLSPATVLPDVAHTYQTSTGPYQPRNYDRRFHGPTRAREALASSYNVPAIALTDRLGAASLLGVLHQAGFATLSRSAEWYGLGLALGNGDVTLVELANGYRALANGGEWRPWSWSADGRDGATTGPAATSTSARTRALSPVARRVVSRGAAALVLDILSDPVARVPGFGLDTPFDFPFPAAVKTGTSHHFTDNWAVAVTGGFTVAVWAGNFSGRPMRQVSGVTGAGPLLHRAVLDVAKRHEPGVLPAPAQAGAVRVRVCRLSGMRATPYCPGVEEWVLPGTEPARPCDWHEPDGAVRWPAEYVQWVADNDLDEASDTVRYGGGVARLAAADSSFRIVSPLDGDRYAIPPGVDARYATIALRAVGRAEDAPVRWLVDGRRAASTRWRLESGTHTVRALAASGRTARVTIRVR